MTDKRIYDYCCFIGRFQPFHSGHYSVVKKALEVSENLIIVIGSHNTAQDIRNPLCSEARKIIITNTLASEGINMDRIHFVFQEDHLYNEERWISGIQTAVISIANRKWTPDPIKIGLIGYTKDHTSYYLRKFPHWETIDCTPENDISATQIRDHFFTHGFSTPDWGFGINDTHRRLITQAFETAIERHSLDAEFRVIQEYRKSWQDTPYPVTFQTVDALVTQSGHILLVRRGAYPGYGYWAMPGGFVDQTETLEEACLRELREETKLTVPTPVLKGSIASVKTFDHPNRSTRGRTITQCYHIKLADQDKLPKIKGSDDADKAIWMPLSEFVTMRQYMFEDHFSIIENMLGI